MASLTHSDVKAASEVYKDVVKNLRAGLKQHVSDKKVLSAVQLSDWEAVLGTLTPETFSVVLSGIADLPLEAILESVQQHPCYIETQFCDKGSAVRIFFYWVEPPSASHATPMTTKRPAPAGDSSWTPLALFLLIALAGYFAYTKKFLIEQYFR